MRSALMHVFRKNGKLLLIIFAALIVSKVIAVVGLVYGSEGETDLSLSERNVRRVGLLIDFADKKEGELPNSLPANYMELLDFYAGMRRPEAIDQTVPERYFDLQKFDAVFTAAALVSVLIWSQYYERGIYRQSAVAPAGGRYRGSLGAIVIAISLSILAANEAADLAVSGFLSNPDIFNASAQSYAAFSNAQNHARLWDVFVFMWIGKTANTVFACAFAEMIARYGKSAKDAVLLCVLVIFMLLFVREGIAGSRFGSMFQIGIVDWEDVAGGSSRFLHIPVSSMTVGCAINCAAAVVSLIFCRRRSR